MAALNEVVWIFIAIAIAFYATSALKSHLRLTICSICIAVSFSWIGLLALRQLGWFNNDIILAILLGQSVVGIYYLWERHARREWLIFRLPMLLTLSLAAWILVSTKIDIAIIVVVGLIWLFHGLLYYYRTRPKVKSHVDKLIDCCSRW